MSRYPFKLKKQFEVISILIVVASFVVGTYFYTHFPAVVVSHWGIQGQPNGFTSALGGAFALPTVMVFVYILFYILPLIDPQKERYADFGSAYQIIKLALILVLALIYFFTGLYNLGYPVNIAVLVPIIIGLLFMVIGNYLGRIKKNWFIGVRTPWTLSSEKVWDKTNHVSGWLFMIAGLILLISPLFGPQASFAFLIIVIICVVFVPIVYSYALYQKERRRK